MNKITKVGNHLNLEYGIKVILLELKNIPKKPGIYKMINSSNEPIYIGKAKNLYKRVLSYTKANKLNRRLITMISNIQKIEINITNSEVEALLLESNLIKKFEPKFNVLLKDDKNYSSIRVELNEEYPRISIVRKCSDKDSIYLGPFKSSDSVRKTKRFFQKTFGLRDCSNNKFNMHRSRACLYKDIGMCLGPCDDNGIKQKYNENVEKINNIRLIRLKAIFKGTSQSKFFELSHFFANE